METKSRKIDLLWAFVLNIFCLIFLMCFYEVIHEANDDLAISFLLEGAYGEYSEYVVYQNVIWARFVVFLNQLVPQIKWYMVIMYLMLFTNFVGVSYVFFRVLGRKMGLLVNAVLVLLCGYNTYVIFQYSRIAAVVTAGAILVLFYAIEHALCKKEKYLLYVLGGVLAVWGSMIRFPMFGIAVAVTGGSIGLHRVWMLLRERKEGWLQKIGTYVAVFGTVGIISLGCYVYDSIQYSSDEYWAEYVEYNEVRTELWDYGFPDYNENIWLYLSMGLSPNDYAFYRSWNVDADHFTMDALYALEDAKPEKEFVLLSFLEVFPRLFEQYSVYTMFIIFALVAVGLNWKNMYYGIYGFLVIMIIEGVFMYLGRCGFSRIDCSMWMVALFALAYGVSDSLKMFKDIPWKWVGLIIGTVVVLNNAHIPQAGYEMSEKIASTKAEYDYIANDKEHLYIVLSLAPSVYYGFDYWEPCELGELSNVYNSFGWEQRMKVKDSILENYGIENIYRDSINNDKVYFVAGPQSEMLEAYVQQHYDPEVRLECVGKINEADIWAFRK